MGMNKEQVKKINEKAGNNFKFYIKLYMLQKKMIGDKNSMYQLKKV